MIGYQSRERIDLGDGTTVFMVGLSEPFRQDMTVEEFLAKGGSLPAHESIDRTDTLLYQTGTAVNDDGDTIIGEWLFHDSALPE